MIRKSYGILCVNPNTKSFLLVRKRVTPAFCDFVQRFYQLITLTDIVELFNQMTYDEKQAICNYNYQYLWYMIFNGAPGFVNSYADLERKFYEKFSRRMLVLLTIGTVNSEIYWEIPKGRKKPNEYEINCALRELYEETGMRIEEYRLISPNIFYSYRIHCRNHQYLSIIYPAISIKEHISRSFIYRQDAEISTAKWVEYDQLDIHIRPDMKYMFNKVLELIKDIK